MLPWRSTRIRRRIGKESKWRGAGHKHDITEPGEAGPRGLSLQIILERVHPHDVPSVKASWIYGEILDPFPPTTYLRDQESSTRSTGRNFLPNGVKEYSTRTGISGNICRLTSSSRSSSRNCCVNTFWEIRGMFWRRALKRSGFLASESHQRITGFQRPPIKTSRCSMGHSLAIRLALISGPVTRYPFGPWYLCNGIRRIGSYIVGNEKRNEDMAPGAVRDCESRAARSKKTASPEPAQTSKATKESEGGISSEKWDTLPPPHSLEFGTSWCVSATAWHGDSPTTSWPETESVGVFTSKEEQK